MIDLTVKFFGGVLTFFGLFLVIFGSLKPFSRKKINKFFFRYCITNIIQIKYIFKDDQEETLKIAGYLNLLWQDEFLYWTPKEEGNITEIKMLANNIWNPGYLYSLKMNY